MYERQRLIYSLYNNDVYLRDCEMFLSLVTNHDSGNVLIKKRRGVFYALTNDKFIERGMIVSRGTNRYLVEFVNLSGKDVIVELSEIL